MSPDRNLPAIGANSKVDLVCAEVAGWAIADREGSPAPFFSRAVGRAGAIQPLPAVSGFP